MICVFFSLFYREKKEISSNTYQQISEIYDSNPESRPFIRHYMDDGYISLRERDTILNEFNKSTAKPIVSDLKSIKDKISK